MKLSYFLMFLKNDILSMLMLMLSKTHKGVRRLAVEKFHNLSQNKRLVVLTMNYQLVLNQNSIKISDQHGKQPLFVAFLLIKILSSWKWVVKEHAMDDWVIYNEHCAIKCLLQLLTSFDSFIIRKIAKICHESDAVPSKGPRARNDDLIIVRDNCSETCTEQSNCEIIDTCLFGICFLTSKAFCLAKCQEKVPFLDTDSRHINQSPKNLILLFD